MPDQIRALENLVAILANDAADLRRIADRDEYTTIAPADLDIVGRLTAAASELDAIRRVVNTVIDGMYGPNGRPE